MDYDEVIDVRGLAYRLCADSAGPTTQRLWMLCVAP